MERTPVSSSSIRSLGFDPETGVCEVEYQNGVVYQASGMTAEQFQAILAAESVGSYYARNIRNAFVHTRVEQE